MMASQEFAETKEHDNLFPEKIFLEQLVLYY